MASNYKLAILPCNEITTDKNETATNKAEAFLMLAKIYSSEHPEAPGKDMTKSKNCYANAFILGHKISGRLLQSIVSGHFQQTLEIKQERDERMAAKATRLEDARIRQTRQGAQQQRQQQQTDINQRRPQRTKSED